MTLSIPGYEFFLCLSLFVSYKREELHDHHLQRKGYRPSVAKKNGAGKANWGDTTADYHDAEFPINEPFEDPREMDDKVSS